VEVLAVNTFGHDKESRAAAASPMVEAGKVLLPLAAG